jgi:hypothetical protein
VEDDKAVAPDENEPCFSQDRHVPRETASGERFERRGRPAQLADDPQPLAVGECADGAK